MPSPQSTRECRGFTLIELMVVVAVIAILATIAWPAYDGYIRNAKVRVAQQDLVALGAHMENQRQRTLWYPVAEGAAETVLPDWRPSSRPEEFAFAITSERAHYRATATWRKDGRLAGCVLTLSSQRPTRSATEACRRAGGSDW